MKKLIAIFVLVSLLPISCKKDTLPEVETVRAEIKIKDATHVITCSKVFSLGLSP